MLISWTTILSDAFIFLTKIAIEAISLTVMAVEIVPFLKSPKHNVSVYCSNNLVWFHLLAALLGK